MRTDTPKTIRLSEHTEPTFLVDQVHMTFKLDPKATRVITRIAFTPHRTGDLELDGAALKLISATINGKDVTKDLAVTSEGLTLAAKHLPDGPFEWVAETEINPEENLSLEGLYMSKGMYCTQCEAEGFRKITYYPDRPDVMAIFTVRIEGDLPVMLSNGNPTAKGKGFVEWHDPWPKPSYLFALVAGDLVSFDDTFKTASGRKVDLKIYVRPGDEDQCAYAMDALKRSMRWDEETYGREYDLDLFMIVAVDDFNMGAMENKGLNIFNSKYVLASPETATDTDYALIEGIIAHEYFHNWTGNRITCRDWFQLCLKEGLTVFRDQQFSAHERSEAVQRISDVRQLRARQFPEDAGPLAHPVRPEEYIEINNFYTATVYEKGAELIRMMHLLFGEEEYRKALDLYFERHDGHACTVEDWIIVFEDSTKSDLQHFANWYSQAGTPHVTVREEYADGKYNMTISQETKPTPGQEEKVPLYMPMAFGFLNDKGEEFDDKGVILLTEESQTFTFSLPTRPVASLFRGFSAPVVLHQDLSTADRTLLLAHDTDPFNRWEAGNQLSLETLTSMITEKKLPSPEFLNAMANLASDESADPAFRAMALALPSEDEITRHLSSLNHTPDPELIHKKRNTLNNLLGIALSDAIQTEYEKNATKGAYSPDATAAGKRALKHRALSLIIAATGDPAPAAQLYEMADNMTDSLAALGLLVETDAAKDALADFHERWKDNPNVLDKWFSIQASRTGPDTALEVVQELSEHPDFTWKTPNRYRSLIGVFAMANPAGFHRADGKGYEFVADWLLKLDPINPQTTARLITAFESWKLYDKSRQSLMKEQLIRISKAKDLSKDVSEMVGRILKA